MGMTTSLRSRAIRLAKSLPQGHELRRKVLATITKQEVIYGKEALKKSYQAEFPETVPCVKCGKDSRHVLTLMEGDEKAAFELHPNNAQEGEFWFHDFAAFSLYMCPDVDCLTVTTEWNQR